jgi:hypothetical protein
MSLDVGIGSGSAVNDGFQAVTFGAECVNAPLVASGLQLVFALNQDLDRFRDGLSGLGGHGVGVLVGLVLLAFE